MLATAFDPLAAARDLKAAGLPRKRRGTTLLAAYVIAAVAGCGGGGGGGNVRPDTPDPVGAGGPVETVAHHPPPVDNSMRSASVRAIAQGLEYRGGTGDYNWAIDHLRAADAYARLRTRYGSTTVPGTGRRIAIIDTGIDLTHPEIAPAVAAGRVSCTALTGGQCASPLGLSPHHGTAVSSLILAHPQATRPSTWSFHGIAYGANVDVYAVSLGSGGGDYNPSQPTAGVLRGQANAYKVLLDQALGGTRPDVVNMSFGYSSLAEEYLPHRSSMAGWLSPLISTVRGASNTVFVIAAGNDHGQDCQDSTSAGCGTGKLDATK